MTSEEKLQAIKDVLQTEMSAEKQIPLIRHLSPKLKSVSAWQVLAMIAVLLDAANTADDPDSIMVAVRTLLEQDVVRKADD